MKLLSKQRSQNLIWLNFYGPLKFEYGTKITTMKITGFREAEIFNILENTYWEYEMYHMYFLMWNMIYFDKNITDSIF